MPPAPQSIESILAAAVEIGPEDQRRRFLEGACGGDAELRGRVEELVANHFRAGGFLEAPAHTLADSDDTLGERPGAVVGPYRLLEQLGEGGFGVVFLAEQQEPVRRKVALKVLKPGMDSKQVVARFEAERQALALMDHPHIAKVLDGGATAGGRPYFVMELVRGTRITDFCDQNHLPVRERLGLFLDVCRAVQHAHTKGVIHRDIKPSNVLAFMQDGAPAVKVIDFGVAKAVGQPLTDKTLFTGFAQMVGTPLYMSPEQAGMSELDVDTRSDVYSLGVLLYELLTGTTPFERERFRRVGFDEMRRIIREEEPPRPSTRISTVGQAATTASANRRSDPKRLSRLFRGELDWVAMRALEKDRDRRYESAGALAADVQRYLADEPVLACPPTAGYRLKKLVRRHKGPVLAAAAVTLVLVAGVVGTTAGLLQALAAENRTVTERDAKEEARRQTRQALNTMTDEVIEDLLGRQSQLTDKHRAFLKKVLAHHEAFAAAKADDPEGRQSKAEGLYRVGRIRQTLGEAAEAEAATRAALEIREPLVEELPDRHDFRQSLVRDYLQLVRLQTEHHLTAGLSRPPKEIAEILRKAVAHARRLVAASGRADYREDLANAEHGLSVQLYYGGQPEEAAPLARDAIGIDEQLAKELPGEPKYLAGVATGYHHLALVLQTTRRPKEAGEAYRAALRTDEQRAAMYRGRPEAREELAKCCLTLGVMHAALKEPEKAEKAFNEAVAVGKELAAEFPKRPGLRIELALTQNNLGMLLYKAKRLKEAEEVWGECLGRYRRLAAELHRPDIRLQVADGCHNLGIILMHTGRRKEGVEHWREGLKVIKQLADELPDNPDYQYKLAFHCEEMAHQLREDGHPREAIDTWRRAIPAYEKLRAIANVAQVHVKIGETLASSGKPAEAIAEFEEALRINPKSAGAYYALGNAYFPKQPDKAIAAYRAALRSNDKHAEAHTNLGNALAVKGDLDGAMAEYHKALHINKGLFEAHLNLGVALRHKDRPDEAIVEIREALRLNKGSAAAHDHLGRALQDKGRLEEAVAEHREALRIDKGLLRAQEHLRQAEQLIGLRARLPAVLPGKDRPKDAGECLGLAHLCRPPYPERYAAAARFFAEAFAGQPSLAESLETWDRYNAACSAALAAAGRGQDAAGLDEKARARLRRQALGWLRDDLAAWGRLLDREPEKAPAAVGTLGHWLDDSDFAGVRGPKALAKLPEAERQPWQKLWEDVADTLARARGKSLPEKKSATP